MRYLVLSDIHSNIEALDAVLAAASKAYDAVLVLGDLVGYGADPNAVVERIRALKPVASVRGNHDKVAAGIEDADDFNQMARSAAVWTREALTSTTLDYLRDLPQGPQIVDEHIEICHGSPIDEDLYVVAELDASRAIAFARRPLCLFGHTHVALSARMDTERVLRIDSPRGRPEFPVVLDADATFLVNPGSVGQPRDGDARAAYAIADMEKKTVTLHRVAYAIEEAQKKILKAGLPPALAYRLAMGR